MVNIPNCVIINITEKESKMTRGNIQEYIGPISVELNGVTSGFLADHFGWNATFYLWMGDALAAGILMLLMWNYRLSD